MTSIMSPGSYIIATFLFFGSIAACMFVMAAYSRPGGRHRKSCIGSGVVLLVAAAFFSLQALTM